MKTRTLIWIAVALVVVFFAKDFVQWKSDFRVFAAKRDAWHQQCDAYRGRDLRVPAVAECQRELDALLAEAKTNGWVN